MNLRQPLLCGFVTLVVVLLFHPPDLPAGRPGPPVRQPPQYRQANMLMLRFQDALAEDRWPDALALCSDRVRAKAAEWPSIQAFFADTLPIERVLAQSFGCWSCGTNFYGLFVTLSDYDVTPRVDWNWGIMPAGDKWVVDYPPVKLDEHVAGKKAALEGREERVQAIRRDLEPKVSHISTRLTALSDGFVLGTPMLFRLELVNAGPIPVHYVDSGVRFLGLTTCNEKKEPVPYGNPPSQIATGRGQVSARSSIVLAEAIDINRYNGITEPGKYLVQFDSRNLQIGQPVPSHEPGRFGENLSVGYPSGFLSVTNTFPSNVIEIEAQP